MKMKKGTIVAFVAAGAAVIGGLVAFALYLRAKARDLSEKLDFDGDFYDEDDSLFDTPPEEEDFSDTSVNTIEENNDTVALPVADDEEEAKG